VRGDVVVIPFPFSDLTQTKRRPALLIAALDGDDVILCQITSQTAKDRYAIPLADVDFEVGKLNQPSNVRPNRVFTADSHLILYCVGKLKPRKTAEIIEKLVVIIRT
jgi:mRNA interferase MazF